jgi:hypothetical protein
LARLTGIRRQVHLIQLNQVKAVVVGNDIGFWLLVLDFCSSDCCLKFQDQKPKNKTKKERSYLRNAYKRKSAT